MSGTSMDGIDAALVRISGPASQPRVHLIAFETLAYSAPVRHTILRIAAGEPATAGEISQLNFLLGELFAEAALRVCRKTRVSPSRLAAIGSHGQTIYHQGAPQQGSADLFSQVRGLSAGPRGKAADLKGRSALPPCTLQIAEPSVIAERTGAPVVAGFRTADMAAGGQGAPLVPMVDYLLLRDARQGTVALNIGGIANFTVIPAGAKPDQVFGFDTGPGNMVIDGLVRHFTDGKKAYDAGGRWAAKGRVIEPLLAGILQLPFFPKQPPKSAGREQFGQHFLERFFLGGDVGADGVRPGPKALRPYNPRRGMRPEDLLRTATELTARTITDALERFVLGEVAIHRLIISGGGAHNRLLVARLTDLLPNLRVHRSDEFGLDADAKEAIAFAVLADHTMHSLPGNLPSVTGARRPVVLGKISRP
jgi:anhydro-N-acetylmuramic acid kinase